MKRLRTWLARRIAPWLVHECFNEGADWSWQQSEIGNTLVRRSSGGSDG